MAVRRTLAALGAAALLLAGCGGDPEPKVESPSPAPTTSPSESETAKPMSAQDFVRDWVQLSNQMQVTGTTDDYRAASRRCRPCLDTADRVDDLYASGGHIETDGWKVQRTQFHGSGEERRVDLWVVSSPTLVFKPDGSKERLGGGPNHYELGIRHVANSWVAVSLLEYSE